MKRNPGTGPRKVADLTEQHPFEGAPISLWHCAVCNRYFAARKPVSLLNAMHVVGIYVRPPEPDYKTNRQLNSGRRKWAAALASGDVCTCEAHATWETLDDLDRLLPETREEWQASRYRGFPWE